MGIEGREGGWREVGDGWMKKRETGKGRKKKEGDEENRGEDGKKGGKEKRGEDGGEERETAAGVLLVSCREPVN